MSDGNPNKRGVRVALTKNEASAGPGKELVELSKGWLADGRFESKELEELRAWLAGAPDDTLPAIQFLKKEVERRVFDGGYLPNQLADIQNALLRVIPKKDRDEAKRTRNAGALEEWERSAPEREVARAIAIQDRRERSGRLRDRYANVWANEPATDAQLKFIRDLGGNLPATATKLEASDAIQALLGRESAPSGTHVWGRILAFVVLGVMILIGVMAKCASVH
jgi:hypothetical protein